MQLKPHPAKYSDKIIQTFAKYVPSNSIGLDPMAGTGRIFDLGKYVEGLEIYAWELEPEWALYDSRICVGDAKTLATQLSKHLFDWVATSPPYANRMADHHNAKDNSVRNTYRHRLGRILTEGNVGGMQWGSEYRSNMLDIWEAVSGVIRQGGLFLLNCKNHIRKGQEVDVCGFHVACWKNLQFKLIAEEKIYQKGNRFGENGDKRIDHEMVYVFQCNR